MSAREDFQSSLSKYFEQKTPFSVDIPEEKIEHVMKKIHAGLKENLSFLIVLDYDVDGLCSGSALREVLDACKKADNSQSTIGYYVPSMAEGYGLDYEMLRYLFSEYDNVITVDNGTHAKLMDKLTGADSGRLMGLDHHPYDTEAELPIGMINPNPEGDVSISSGYLVEYLFQKLREKYPHYEEKIPANHIIDLTAISLIGDVADRSNPQVSALIEMGLKEINNRNRGIYRHIFDDDRTITIEDINFNLNPKINAPRRLGIDATRLVETLSDRKLGSKTLETIELMETADKVRKDATNYYFSNFADKEAKRYMDENPNASIIVQMSNEYPLGLNGILAAMVAQKYDVDAFICSRNTGGDNKFTGSGRGGTIKDRMLQVLALGGESDLKSELLVGGGHRKAIGGVTGDPKKLKELVDEFNKKKPLEIKQSRGLSDSYISEKEYDIADYKEMCLEYDRLTRGIPMTESFFSEVGVYVVGPSKAEVEKMEEEGNQWMLLRLRDEAGETLSIRTKTCNFIDYDSLSKQNISIAVNPYPDKDSFDGGIFAQIAKKPKVKEIRLLPDHEEENNMDNALLKKARGV